VIAAPGCHLGGDRVHGVLDPEFDVVQEPVLGVEKFPASAPTLVVTDLAFCESNVYLHQPPLLPPLTPSLTMWR
jgi:hypothetical protein